MIIRRIPRFILFAVTLAFLLFPLAIIVPLSLNSKTYNVFPPSGLSLRWYEDFLGNSQWMDPLWLSVRLGVITGVVATALGLMSAVALVRLLNRGRTLVRITILSPLIVPYILTAIASYDMFTQLRLTGSMLGLVIAHTIVALPFTVIILAGALQGVDRRLEEAAMTMGATAVGAFVRITVPAVAPALATAFVMAFLTSWDEVVLALFLAGDTPTLPVRMLSFMTTQIRPTIAAVSTLLLFAVVAGIVAQRTWASWRRRSALRERQLARASDRQLAVGRE